MRIIDRKTKKLITQVSFILILLAIPLIMLGFVSLPPDEYISQEEAQSRMRNYEYYATNFANPVTGLFIETSIESNYWAIDSIGNATNSTEWEFPKTVIKSEQANYLLGRQLSDGGFGEVQIAGTSTIIETYQVISALNELGPEFISDNMLKLEDTIEFVLSCLAPNASGFNMHPAMSLYQNQSIATMQATYAGISILNILDPTALTASMKTNLSAWINSTSVGGGYAINDNIPVPDVFSTYAAIEALAMLGDSLTPSQNAEVLTFITLCRRPDGGFAPQIIPYTPNSDLQATYYAHLIHRQIDEPLPQSELAIEFAVNCNNSDGGFRRSPLDNVTTVSTFSAVAAGVQLLAYYDSMYLLPDQGANLLYWYETHCGINSLFGYPTLRANHVGLSTIANAIDHFDKDRKIDGRYQWPDNISVENISLLVDSCYDEFMGGFSQRSGAPSSLYSTHMAVQIHKLINDPDLQSFSRTLIPNITAYIESHYNFFDGGYRIGNDIAALEALDDIFGGYAELLNVATMFESNKSFSPATFWAIDTLSILGTLNESRVQNTSLWLLSCQNADGGFGIVYGATSDVLSTYYNFRTTDVLNIRVLSENTLRKYLRSAQSRADGGFVITPMLSYIGDDLEGSYVNVTGNLLSSNFEVTYYASYVIYRIHQQPANMTALNAFIESCIDGNTGAMSNYPSYGAVLYLQANAIDFTESIRLDRSFNREPWSHMLILMFFAELFIIIGGITLIGIFKITRTLFESLKAPVDTENLERYAAINVRNLNVYAGGNEIIHNCTLQLDHSEILGVLGESGAGKSTFVKALLGMRKFSGTNRIYGLDVSNSKTKKILMPLFGYVPQDLSKIYPNFTVMDNLLTFGSQYGLSEILIKTRGMRILKSLGIHDKADQTVSTLSGGQKRRVSIAIALIHNPIICVLDEPTSGLDPVVRQSLWLSLIDINEMLGTTLIVITHYPEESRFCHKVAIFGRGKGLVDYGDPNQLIGLLPGNGRAIEVILQEAVPNTLNFLSQIDPNSIVLERKNDEEFLVFTNMNFASIEKALKESKSPVKEKIATLEQIDAQMEHFFRYRFLEVEENE